MDTDEKKNITGEYTIHVKGNKITGYDKGIGDVALIGTIKESVLEKMVDKGDDFIKHPHSAVFKIMPMYMKHILKGDVKYSRGKKKK